MVGESCHEDIDNLMQIGGHDPKIQRELFGKVGRITYDVQDIRLFERMFALLKSSNANAEMAQG